MAHKTVKALGAPGFNLTIALDGACFLTLTENTISGLSLSPEREEAIRSALKALSTFVECSDHGRSEPPKPHVDSSEGLMGIPEWLSAQTYRVEYNPNCPKPFMVRLVAKNRGRIYGDNEDALGYGKTLAEAAEAAKEKARIFTKMG